MTFRVAISNSQLQSTMNTSRRLRLNPAAIFVFTLLSSSGEVYAKRSRSWQRFLEDAAVVADDGASGSAYSYDLSDFSLHYDKCQYVRMYDDDKARDESSASPLALKQFVVFRLCPTTTDGCSTCDAEDGVVYGKYATQMDTYLQVMVPYHRNALEEQCNACGQNCNNNNNNIDDSIEDSSSYCSTCASECDFLNNLANNGYVDASEYIQCQALQAAANNQGADDAANDQNSALYIGPNCNSNGQIVIGLFADEECTEALDNMDVESVLGAQLSYHAISYSYSNRGCISCKNGQNVNDDGNAMQQNNDAQDVCENLYLSAAKCDPKDGLYDGFTQFGQQQDEVTRNASCTFVDSLIWNSYTQTGVINTKAKQDVIIRKVTKNQKVSLSLVTLAFLGLIGAAYYMDQKIKKLEAGYPLIFRGEHKFT